jgi:tetratricopeptide (TPR) repeat protein
MRALQIRRKVLRPGHPEITKNLMNLAVLEAARKNLEGAEEYYRQAAAGNLAEERSLDPDIAHGLEEYASILRRKHEYAEAEKLSSQAMTIRVRSAINTAR